MAILHIETAVPLTEAQTVSLRDAALRVMPVGHRLALNTVYIRGTGPSLEPPAVGSTDPLDGGDADGPFAGTAVDGGDAGGSFSGTALDGGNAGSVFASDLDGGAAAGTFASTVDGGGASAPTGDPIDGGAAAA